MPTLHVEGVDPTRIECRTDQNGERQAVLFDRVSVATLWKSGSVEFDGIWNNVEDRTVAHKVMNACIDHWRLTGRLFPEAKVEPVACVCGAKPWVGTPRGVYCESGLCCLRANTVAQWNIIQAALKGAK